MSAGSKFLCAEEAPGLVALGTADNLGFPSVHDVLEVAQTVDLDESILARVGALQLHLEAVDKLVRAIVRNYIAESRCLDDLKR